MTVTTATIRLAYRTGFRQWENERQRRLKGEHRAPRHPVTVFSSPAELERFMRPLFDWREDADRVGGITFPLDYVSHPEVFEARLRNDLQVRTARLPFLGPGERRLRRLDGDCDDVHFWAATSLLRTPGVDRVLMCYSGFPVRKGHATCVYRWRRDWYHLDYRIRSIRNPNDAPELVAERYTGEDRVPRVPWYVFETTRMELVACGPGGRDSRVAV